MRKKFKGLFLALTILALVLNTALPALAQNPTGSIRGVVTDPQGAVVTNAKITVKNKATGEVRNADTGGDGLYTVANLLPGEYEISITAEGFATTNLPVTVSVGTSTTGDVSLKVGGKGEVVDIVAGTATLEKESAAVAGVINQKKIEALPLNGRNFLQLAALEPGVSVITKNPGAQNNLFNVSIGGADSALTRLTVDGGSIVDPVCGGAAQNFSTETVQEFQISTYNFDLSTGVTSVGAINIVTRTGSNDLHGSGFLYFRDDKLAAIPTLNKPSKTFDPAFRRYQYGGSVGGPIKKDKAFFFGNIEWLNQNAIVSNVVTGFNQFNPAAGAFVPITQFNTNFSSPYKGVLANVRTDIRLSDKNTLFSRYSFDDNKTLAPDGNNILPSRWRDNKSRDHNAQAGLTTILTQKLVNDFRFNYQRITNDELTPSAAQCPPSEIGCIGLGGNHINIVSSNLAFGNTTNAPQNRRLNRWQYTDNLSWEKGAHRVRVGGEFEHDYGFGKWAFLDPGLLILHNPNDVIATNFGVAAAINANPNIPAAAKPGLIAALNIPLPAAFTTPGAAITLNDILQLPLAIGFVGIGDPQQPPPFNEGIARQANRYRFYAQDSWRIRPNFTFLFGASYQYETNLANHDLTKPALLKPLLGNLGKPGKDKNNIAPSIGFNWDVGSKGKTVIRGGFGIYYDTVLFVTRLQERATNGPAGNGRSVVPTAYFQNTFAFPQIPGLPLPLSLINPALGTSVNFTTIPTKFTAANFLSLYNAQGPIIQSGLRAAGAAGFSGLDFFKSGNGILDPNLQSPYSEQFTFGVQRQLTKDMILNVDFVRRNRVHSLITNQDFNQFDRVGGPRIPRCVGAAAINPAAQCSNGPINVTLSAGRSNYKAMLVKLDKRFSSRYQLTASYALASRTEFATGENLNDWFGNPFPAGSRHTLTISGVVELPWGIQGSLISYYSSREPFNAKLAGSATDLNGDGTRNDTIPGIKFNSLGRSVSKNDFIRIVQEFNANFAGKLTPNGATIARVNLPAHFDFGDNFISQDIRFSKAFKFAERYTANFFIEGFNIFNIANLTGYSTTLDNSFGQPTGRAGQNFGTGGPRAFQIGGRFSF
ncbi:MAG: carboxypeptidase regulatory-like domain-containing protein [Acidobacteria bacterium]|nr:carboxypeptidase regulatory-like domain-containing protein [Acidobacteriota bacterium]